MHRVQSGGAGGCARASTLSEPPPLPASPPPEHAVVRVGRDDVDVKHVLGDTRTTGKLGALCPGLHRPRACVLEHNWDAVAAHRLLGRTRA
eukprot:361264-Chlamydomonas_euryale.AAC.5